MHKFLSLSHFQFIHFGCCGFSLPFLLYLLNATQQAPSDISKLNSNGLERLKKRMGQYRQHHTECGPRFDQSFTGACEQQSVETVILQQRFLENKAKKAAKKADKKQPENSSLAGNLQSSVHVVSLFPFFSLSKLSSYLLAIIQFFCNFPDVHLCLIMAHYPRVLCKIVAGYRGVYPYSF